MSLCTDPASPSTASEEHLEIESEKVNRDSRLHKVGPAMRKRHIVSSSAFRRPMPKTNASKSVPFYYIIQQPYTTWKLSRRLLYLTNSSIKHKSHIRRLAPSRWWPRHRDAALLSRSLPYIPLRVVQQRSTQVLVAPRNGQDVFWSGNIGKNMCEKFDGEYLEVVTPGQRGSFFLGFFFCGSVCSKPLVAAFL